MTSQKLREWVKEKRDEGVSEERIRKILEKTGHDPDIIDNLDDPFDSSQKDVDIDEASFEISNKKDSKNSFEPEKTTDKTQETSANNSDKTEKSASNTGFQKGSGFNLRSYLPDLNYSFSRRQKVICLVSILFLVVLAGIYGFSEYGGDIDLFSNSNIDSSTSLETLTALDERHEGCPNGGVRIESISVSEGKTTADVLVTEKSWVVLEIIQGQNVIGFSTQEVEGQSVMSVDKVGQKANLRPLGCDRYQSSRTY